MKFDPHLLVAGFPEQAEIFSPATNNGRGAFVRLPKSLLSRREIPSLSLPGLTRFVALQREYPLSWWVIPKFGTTAADFARIDKPATFFLWQREDGSYGLLLPIVDRGVRGELAANDDTLTLTTEGPPPGEEPDGACVLYVATGDDPYQLPIDAAASVAAHLKTFRLRTEKRTPAFAEYLGWCTWDAFYQEVDEPKVLAGLESFKQGGFVPRFLLLDDGWQETRDRRMVSMGTDPRKFPQGLEGVIRRAREEYGVEHFGVWHALQGYWEGIDPQGPLAAEYRLVQTHNATAHPPDAKPFDRWIIHPDDVDRFFQRWYRQLRAQGVDMTKVDNQSSLPLFFRNASGPGSSGGNTVDSMKQYQYALQGAAQTHFEGNLLHCMSNQNDVAYHMQSSSAWRNSNDFYPSVPASHQQHLVTNALNNLWSRTFALPDWDMFQTTHPAGWFHAAARAISGSPIYVSDKTDGHDFKLLNKLATNDGRALRCRNPALPSPDCLFTDTFREDKLLKITNQNVFASGGGGVGVLGLFHCKFDEKLKLEELHTGAPITDSFAPADVPYLKGAKFAVWLHDARTLLTMKRKQTHAVTLRPLGWEIATISPIEEGIAPLGLVEKFNGTAAIESAGWIDNRTYRCVVRDGGRIGFYCDTAPRKVIVNGKKVKSRYHKKTGLLIVKRPAGKRVDLLLVD